MALNSDDARPTNLASKERYGNLYSWFQANASKFAAQNDGKGRYARQSIEYIRSLPSPASATPAEIEAVFKEVLMGRLEWAYHESDGKYKMAAYAGA